MDLRIIDNLTNIIEHDNVALEGELICDCENARFEIHHSGKQTRGILAPYLVKKDKQILRRCSNVVLMYIIFLCANVICLQESFKYLNLQVC